MTEEDAAERLKEWEILKNRFIELDKQKAEIKKFFDSYAEAVENVAEWCGIGSHFQDDEGTVYQVEIPSGKFVYFEKYEIKRTRREGEKAGTLSLTKAKELGYDLETK